MSKTFTINYNHTQNRELVIKAESQDEAEQIVNKMIDERDSLLWEGEDTDGLIGEAFEFDLQYIDQMGDDEALILDIYDQAYEDVKATKAPNYKFSEGRNWKEIGARISALRKNIKFGYMA